MSKKRQFCTFFVDKHFFGVDVQKVHEVILYQEMTQVPLAPAAVRGLINLRGQIVTAIDLRHRLALSQRPLDKLFMNVVLRLDNNPVSLLVDKVGDVLEVEAEQFEFPPETVQGLARELIEGVYKLEDRLLLILNIEKTVDLTFTS